MNRHLRRIVVATLDAARRNDTAQLERLGNVLGERGRTDMAAAIAREAEREAAAAAAPPASSPAGELRFEVKVQHHAPGEHIHTGGGELRRSVQFHPPATVRDDTTRTLRFHPAGIRGTAADRITQGTAGGPVEGEGEGGPVEGENGPAEGAGGPVEGESSKGARKGRRR